MFYLKSGVDVCEVLVLHEVCVVLSVQSVVRALCAKSGAVEQFYFLAELTNRDKDHVSCEL